MRTVPIIPVAKDYLLNGHQGLLGFCKIEASAVDFPDGESTQMYDVPGLEVRVFRHPSIGPSACSGSTPFGAESPLLSRMRGVKVVLAERTTCPRAYAEPRQGAVGAEPQAAKGGTPYGVHGRTC